MSKQAADREILRPLAERYSAIAHRQVQQQRLERYRRTNDLEEVRPIVLIDEVPWGEIRDDALVGRCQLREHAWIEGLLRRALYQWDHFQVDLVVPPVFRVPLQIRSTGIGLTVQETTIQGDTGAYIMSHEYHDQLRTDEDLARLQLPVISCDREATDRLVEAASGVLAGLMDVETVGTTFAFNIWDDISCYRGVSPLLMDLACRPDFMHRAAARFQAIAAAIFRQYLDLGVLNTRPVLLHCTPACTRELPAPGFAGTVRPQDVWGRCSAQIFSAVSPAMHDEFDLTYSQEVFGACGLLYYGCCEPLDTKIDILRKRFPNLRKVSITPWADPEVAAERMGRDVVMSAKPNPAFVGGTTFEPEPVRQEIARYLSACQRHGTTCDLVLKDISTIANRPENLTRWAETVESVIDEYY